MKWSEKVDNELFEVAINIGPWLVPIATALVFGVAFAQAVAEKLGWLAGVAGFFAAIGLEVTGIIGFHSTIALYSRKKYDKAIMGLFAGLSYVSIGIGGVWTMEAEGTFKTVGTISFLIIPIVYLGRALIKDLIQMDQKQVDAKEKEAKLFVTAEAEKIKTEERAEREKAASKAELRAQEKEAKLFVAAEAQKIRDEKRAERLENKQMAYQHEVAMATLKPVQPSVDSPVTDVDILRKYADSLQIVQQKADGPINVHDIQDWLDVGRSTAYEILKLPGFQRIGHGRYEYTNGKG